MFCFAFKNFVLDELQFSGASPPPNSFFGPLFGANLMRLSNLIPMRNHISRHLLIEPENVLWLMSF